MHILSCKFAIYELNLTSGTKYNKVNDISVPFCWIYAILINRNICGTIIIETREYYEKTEFKPAPEADSGTAFQKRSYEDLGFVQLFPRIQRDHAAGSACFDRTGRH